MPLEFKFLYGPETPEAEVQLPEGQRVTWPTDSIVLYVTEDEKVVGRLGCMTLKILEGAWCAPGHTTLAYRLMKQMEMFLVQIGSTSALALSYEEAVGDYLQRLGFSKFPVTLYEKSLIQEKSEAA